eukprot:TRINITY_DN16994_c0_g1_i1.p1 TRINITY_DN16994_c0_g1~~TRINITY_DN16994_c0_g1_i1.p1  ORF type:complete len:353 (-),score=62.99 TRINITY_DN16994_c0_g1_i1:109-1167(-)
MVDPHITYMQGQGRLEVPLAPQPLAPHLGSAVPRYGGEAPPVAAQVAEQALADDETREYLKQQALVLGGHVAGAAKYYGHQGLMAFQDYIEQGPKGMSTLCFVAGCATSTIGVMSVCNFFGSVLDPFHYTLGAYTAAFGIATACIEADTDRIGMLIFPFDRLAEPITRCQAWLHEECKLLTTLRGRGLFYFYQGSLMVTQCTFCTIFLVGLWNALLGAVCVFMSCGFKPDIEGMVNYSGVLGTRTTRYDQVPTIEDGQHNANMTALLARVFARAETLWKEKKDKLSGKACRELWALHKQATVGDCNEPKPTGIWNGSAKEQWRLWNGLQGMSTDEAKEQFIQRLAKDGIHVS